MSYNIINKIFFILLVSSSNFAFSQTITIPATTIPYNPGSNTVSIPTISLTLTPAATPTPIDSPALKKMDLDIVSVDYKAGIHEVTGYDKKTGALVNQKVLFGRNKVLANYGFTRPKISIITVPFKIRGAIDTFPTKAIAGLSNIGLSLNLINFKLDRYFNTGTKSTHIFSAGVFGAPNVEEIAPETTNNKVAKKSSQLFISTGITLTYSYGDVSFVLVPLGFDFGTTGPAREYIYNGKRWWGFGLGISTKLFGLL